LGRIVNEGSLLGQTLGALFGYSASPSLMQVLVYTAYFGTVLVGILNSSRKQRAEPVASSTLGGKPA
jgi:hypothetical protein